MNKELHIWMNEKYPKYTLVTYNSTEDALKNDSQIVNTTIPNFFSTQWLVKGYRLFAHMIDGETIEIKLGCDNKCTDREIRVEHNIHKMLLANCFGKAIR